MSGDPDDFARVCRAQMVRRLERYIPPNDEEWEVIAPPGMTALCVSGTVQVTLSDPTFAGQRRVIVCTRTAATPTGTLRLGDER